MTIDRTIVKAYKTMIAPNIYEKLGMKTTTFSSVEEAADTLEKLFIKAELKYTIKEEGKSTVYYNDFGGWWVRIHPAI